jgi:SH3-like domain-containing protein
VICDGGEPLATSTPTEPSGWQEITVHLRLSRVIAAGTLSVGLLFAGAAPLPSAALPTAAAATTSASKATAGASRTTTANLNLRKGPGRSYGVIKVLRKGVRVTLTGRTSNGFTKVRNGNGTGWVSTKYLTASKAVAKSTRATPKGLKPNAAKTYRAAVTKFPRIKTVHGVRPGANSDHSTGRAVDLMIPNYKSASGKKLGGDVAAWARTNARSLGINYVIWNQRIWSVARSKEGWRAMASRGGDSANHKDHVHISVR